MIIHEFEAAFELMKKLSDEGFDAVVVGGAVRDTLLGAPVHDVDVATSAKPEQMKQVFKKTVDIGIEHGTILVLDAKEPVEVTTYRTEGTYVDHRRPDQVNFVTDLAEDLKRRDFTINAMALRLNNEVVDLFGGQQDLKAKKIRAVGIASERFQEDALRMLRAVRFSAKLNFTIEEETLRAMTVHASDLQFIAMERIKAEFDQIVRSAHPYVGFKQLKETTLAAYVPGNFEKIEQWKSFSASSTEVGWAMFSYLENDPNLVKAYRGSNKESQFVQHVLRAIELLHEPIENRSLFDIEQAVWQAAVMIYNHVEHGEISIEEIVQRKRALPIASKQQLAVTGKHLLEWTGQKGGPWLKQALDQLVTDILEGRVQNEEQHIKGWVERECRF
ncbi:CCA tRNA nucleotidyltransferase [Kurthia senegalensis]|uniref:CCA tRNA nucleotidyltransferase n=1 Tax=Kurthia senegalensis TaxID=1033740 RepID=UPI000287B508|nr:CCA tRNA nucleotidyltransferase [Kurthia senegalensis]